MRFLQPVDVSLHFLNPKDARMVILSHRRVFSLLFFLQLALYQPLTAQQNTGHIRPERSQIMILSELSTSHTES